MIINQGKNSIHVNTFINIGNSKLSGRELITNSNWIQTLHSAIYAIKNKNNNHFLVNSNDIYSKPFPLQCMHTQKTKMICITCFLLYGFGNTLPVCSECTENTKHLNEFEPTPKELKEMKNQSNVKQEDIINNFLASN